MAQRALFSNKVTREELNSLVDKAADLIRTAVDYKFILVLLFLKRLNDLWKVERLQVKERLIGEIGLSERGAEEEAAEEVHHTFNIPKEFLWDEVTKDVRNLPERLGTAISEVAKLNKELQGVIDRVDFLEFARNQENRELLRQLVELFNKYDLGGEEVSPDILGDAYEHILMKFAPQRAKEGEIYTPREVIRLVIEILDAKPGESVYDPCCGSGGMLITSHLHVAEEYGQEETRRLFLYGQERSPEIYAVCQMNLMLHDIRHGNIANGDTLDYPRFREDSRLKQFDMVIANIPWNQKGYGKERLKRSDFGDRFSFGYSPQKSADWAWIQHMLASAAESGRIGLVVDEGCLFRGGSEKVIRSRIIKKDWIDSIILLPSKLFYNTGAAGVILVFNKNKLPRRRNKILFINASSEFIPHPSIRRLNSLSQENIGKAVGAYRAFKATSGFSRVADRNEVEGHEYNLNVSLYVMPIEEREEIDIRQAYQELRQLEEERKAIGEKVEDILKGLMHQLLTKGVGNKEFKETEIGRIPKDWEIVELGDKEVGRLQDGDWILRKNYTSEGVRLLQVGDIGTGEFLDVSNRFISTETARELNCTLVRAEEDILISRMPDPIGRACLAPRLPYPYIVAVDITIFTLNKNKADPKFMVYALNDFRMLKEAERWSSGATRPRISRKHLEKIKIALPPLREQRRIARILSTVDEKLKLERKETARFERIKQGLMDLLLSGAIRVKVN